MNKYQNVLDAWITIEQLSEGTISRKDKTYDLLYTTPSDWKDFFIKYIHTQKRKNRLSERQFLKSGVVIYFGIFDFEEVVEILREKYKIKKTDEEIAKSEKFTLALYFNCDMQFLEEYLFLTSSGYIRNKGDLPEDLLKVEKDFKAILSRRFENDFNATFHDLFTRYKVSSENFRFKYLPDIENGDVNLHSFFIADLTRVKQVNNANLTRYVEGFNEGKYNLDSNKHSDSFNPTIFKESVLQPKNYPLGRFPSNISFALSLMQQAAVNVALNDKNKIVSVNGPPGTGKTTLLKDIFADLIVQQAFDIVSVSKKNIEPMIVYYKTAKFGSLPASIAEKNIIVASSNNGAVQNIVNELPKIQEIDEIFIDAIQEVDYFSHISNCHIEKKFMNNKFEITSTFKGYKNWGTFSMEGGKASNIEQLILTIESIIKYLKENYIPEPAVYEQFKTLYKMVDHERQKVQHLSEKFYKLQSLRPMLVQKEQHFQIVKHEKKQALHVDLDEAAQKIAMLETTITKLTYEQQLYTRKREALDFARVQAERDFEVIQSQRPSFIWLQKMFFKAKVNRYFGQLNEANEQLQQIDSSHHNLLKLEDTNEKNLHMVKSDLQKSIKVKQIKEGEFDTWLQRETERLHKIRQQIQALENEMNRHNIKGIPFDISYEELQKSNPWFTETFRDLQTQLFIVALKVRKQFLYDNIRNLNAAAIIWNKRGEHAEKSTGKMILKEAWQWINFAIPVISTTFASFGRMFKSLDENSLGHLFIDEAGQALPQASVGAIFRSKKIIVVGDPSQIQPVLTLDSNVLNLIGQRYSVDERYVSIEASTQTLTDAASQFGYYRNEDEWVGVPLWVHRRCNEPMFSISNAISYNGLMVQGKKQSDAMGKAIWFDVKGNAHDKYVKEQGEKLKELIVAQLTNNPELADEIYVITPFRNVANQLVKILDKIHFTKRVEGRVINVGTVHTFQGKEAKIVYLVLGTDSKSKGAASWAVSDPNIMNVAATRAKEEFYIIGDKQLYASLGSRVADETIKNIEQYNTVKLS